MALVSFRGSHLIVNCYIKRVCIRFVSLRFPDNGRNNPTILFHRTKYFVSHALVGDWDGTMATSEAVRAHETARPSARQQSPIDVTSPGNR